MERLQREAVLLRFIEELRKHGSWCGETHIQKATYFLEELLRVPLGYEFILYKHGPFSFDLSDDLSDMRGRSFLQVLPQPPYGPKLVRGENAESLDHLFPAVGRVSVEQLRFIAGRLGKKGVVELEQLGTALYVTAESPKATVQKRVEHVMRLKPHITSKEALLAMEEIDKLIIDSAGARAQGKKKSA